MSKAIMVDIEKCLACRSCEIACALAHSRSGILGEALTEQPMPQRRVSVVPAGEFAVPIQCRHCEDAPCIKVCPSQAIHRHGPEDPVLIRTDLCIGCKLCLMVCPFGVIELSRDGKAVVKCDLCIKRTREGEPPACVESCPTRALQFGDTTEWTKQRRDIAAKAAVAQLKGRDSDDTEGTREP